jgi:hypothetical protein
MSKSSTRGLLLVPAHAKIRMAILFLLQYAFPEIIISQGIEKGSLQVLEEGAVTQEHG